MKLKLQIAWTKGFNTTSSAPLPNQETIDISLALAEDEETAFDLGAAFGNLWGLDDERINVHDGSDAKPKTPGRLGLQDS